MKLRLSHHLYLLNSFLAAFALSTAHSVFTSNSSSSSLHDPVGAVYLPDSTRTGIPSDLNVTKFIPYVNILNRYIASKDQGSDHCPSLRPRVEWRILTKVQRQKYYNSIWCLSARPSLLAGTETNLTGRRTSLLDDFALIHIRLFLKIHYVSHFLPWHRYFVHAREVAMRDCGYDEPFPYWDWAIDADTGNVQGSSVLSGDFGVGGNGSEPDGTVTSGPFAYLPLSYRNDPVNLSTPVYDPHYLQRSFGTFVTPNKTYPMFEEGFNSSAVQRVFVTSGSNFSTFSTLLEGLPQRKDIIGAGPHSAIHQTVGGDMRQAYSPNEPIFFLHHANIDRLWWNWQNEGKTGRGQPSRPVDPFNFNRKFWAYSGNTVELQINSTGGPQASLFDMQTLQGFILPNIETYKLMDITRPPLCYTYI
ncbi:hypothetical protein CF319_g6368 [Tilletia indica]|nr:hypothetical protein CF319_g6368 [Tilletia indica]